MTRRAKSFSGLASILALTHLVLSLFAISCAFEHDQSRPPGHHHGGVISHSDVCAWACQVNPPSDAGPSAFVFHSLPAVALLVEQSPSVFTGRGLFHAASRAPPALS